MQNDTNLHLKNFIETRKNILEKFEKTDFNHEQNRSDFLLQIHALLGKNQQYEKLHLFVVQKTSLTHTHIHYGSSKVNEKVVNNIHIFDHEIAYFTEENIIFIDHLNQSDFTKSQTPDIFDSNCENQSIDLPLYHENKLFGIMRFEASTKPFSETFIFEVMSIFEFLKKRELKKIISQLNMKLEMLSSYMKGIINKHHLAIFKYHISSKTMHFEEGSQLLFNKKNLNDIDKDFFITYIHPNDLELLQLSIKQVIQDHQSISLTYRLKIDDEYKTYLSHMIYTSIYQEQYIIGLIEDLTNPLAKVQNLEKYQI
ncbi:MAG: hypothetical protein RBT45_06520, partial [Acholeplasmataceae bacterium]|nr:hypothetical protein [Acholeplasmataceae bacterium]